MTRQIGGRVATLQITFVSESAGYQNTLGWYNTRTGEAGIIFLNTNDDGPNAGIAPGDTAYLDVEQSDLDAGYIGFFLIPNGAQRYGTGEDSVLNGPLTFDTKGNGDGKILDADGHNLTGAQGEVIFSDPAFNKKDVDYTQGDDDGSILGQIAFEDMVKKSDGDFDDLVIDVQIFNPNQPPSVDDQSFHVDENSAAGTVVARVAASDPEGGPLSYAIIGGNERGTFEIDAGTGVITLAEGGVLDFETLSSYTLTVQVTDGGGLTDTAEVQINVNNVLETLAGRALDGYIAGATVFADQDGDGVLDAGEVSATTDTSGSFALIDGSGPLVMFGGTDVATGLAFTGVLRAPAGATVVTPLTTIVAALVDAGQSPAAAAADVASAFGLDALGIDLLSFDPIPAAAAGGPEGAAAAQVLAAGVQVQNALTQIGALLSGAGAVDAHAAVVAALAGLTASGAPIDLTDATSARALIAAAAAAGGVAPEAIDAVVGDAALVLAATNAAAADAVAAGGGIAALEALAQAAAVAQGPALADALGQAGATNAPGSLAQEYTGQSLETKIADAAIGDVDGGTVGTPDDDVLIGTPGNDLIDGLAGNDLLQGLEGNDRLLGGDGDDVLEGGLGHDFLRGGPGNDILNGGVLADFQSDIGFRDTDRADYSTAAAGVVVNLATGQAFDGDGGTDTLIGIEGVNGSPHDDVLIGSSAFSENWRGGGGNDFIDGGGGFDRAEYVDATSGVTITLGGFGGSSSAAGAASGASVGTDALINVESFIGSDFDDTYVAGLFVSGSLPGGFFSTFNSFEGRGGDDLITGNGATRVEYTSATGGVTANLALGFATGDSSVGTDTFTGVSDVRGSSFADTLIGGNPAFNGFEGYDGRGGDDYIDGGQGWDRADYAFNGAASRGIHVQLAAGIVSGDPLVHGTDTLRGIESVRGSHLDDLFDATGFSGASTNAGWSGTLNEFSGMAGNDTIIGNGNTRIGYTLAREGIVADLALGAVVGGASVGVDIVSGVSEVFGTNFDDTLRGGSGSEVLLGLNGNDLLVGGAGNDLMDGGGGIDRADYSDSIGGVFVDLLFNAANDGMGGTDTLFNIEDVVGTSFNDTLFGNWANNTLRGGLGSDFLRGGGGNDVLDGGVIADLQSDVGWRDFDRVDYSTALWGVRVNLAIGVAEDDGEGGVDTLFGIEAVNGSDFDDVLTGSDTTFSENFRGGGGNDQIHGGRGFDRAEYDDATSGLTFWVGGFAGFAASTSSVVGDPFFGTDTLDRVEQFTGSDFDDIYTVGWFLSDSLPGGFFSSFNSFEGRAGNDTIYGNFNTRADYTSATGPVTVNLGLGTAIGDASVGIDTLFGVNQVRASGFDDVLIGGSNAGVEFFDGRGGNDFIDGGHGWDRADYAFNGPVAIGITVDLAAGTVIGDPVYTGADTLRSVEAIRGSHQADVYDATGFSSFSTNAGSNGPLNEFEGMAGDDIIIGNGATRVSYGLAREGVTIDLLAGTAIGGASVGTDALLGGIVEMRGSNFDDVLMGTNNGLGFAEVYEGLGGNDTFIGRGGVDRAMFGSAGVSGITVVMATAAGSNIGTVTGDSAVGSDTLIDIAFVQGTFLDDTYDATGYFSPVTGLGSFNEFEGGDGNDTIIGNGSTRVSYLSSWSGVTVDLGLGTASSPATGNDTLINIFNVRGSNLGDTLLGGAGNNTFEGRGGFDHIDGGAGFDLVRYDNGSFGGGQFVADATGAFNAFAPGHDNDYLVSVESIRGTNFDDTFDGSASFAGYTFDARGGNDTLIGSRGPDSLLGGDGNDLLRGGWGGDFIDGGAGADRIDYDGLLDAGDTIVGFQAGPGGDVLDLADLLRNETSYAGGAGGLLSDFVRIEAAGPDGLLQIDPDGLFGPQFWQTLAVLVGGAGLAVDTLLAQGNLHAEAPAGITLIGTDGNDVLIGGPGDDTLMGLLGNDFLRGGAGNDLLDGGIVADFQSDEGFRDNDRADYSTAPGGVTVNLATGTASDGAGGLDTLIGIESVNGSMHDDVLIGSSAFSENFHGGAGNDLIQGGGGNDRAEYAGATAGVTITLGGFGGFATSTGTVSGDASVGTDTLVDVEQVMGSEFADTYRAGAFQSNSGAGGFFSSFNAFEGRGGNDSIIGNGSTRIDYNNAMGAVNVNLATGIATGDASTGTDTFSGVNAVRGSAFADTLLGGNPLSDGFESFDGRGGNDFIGGGSGWDRADYAFNGPITTGIQVYLAAGTVTGDPVLTGTDTLRGIESVRGSHRDDYFDASDFSEFSVNAGWFGPSNEFEGMAGNDTFLGNGFTSIVFFSAREGVSVDLIAGTATGGPSVGNDTILGGVFRVAGSNFDDTIVGSFGNEVLIGRDGNDLLRGGGGFDFLDGGPGSDRFDFDSPWEGADTIPFFEAFPGGDVLDIGDLLLNWTSYGGGAGGPLTDFVRLESLGIDAQLQIDVDGLAGPSTWQTLVTLLGLSGFSLETLLANGNLDIEAEIEDLTLIGTDGDNFLAGGPGNDTLIGLLGNDFLYGGRGNDLLDGGVVADLQSDIGWRDFDRVDYSTALVGVEVNLETGVAFDGEGGVDTLIGIEAVNGSMFNDVLIGSAAFSESFHGVAGDDFIDGRGGFDRAEYFSAGAGVSINLGSFGGPADASGSVSGDASVGFDTLLNIEQFGGSDFADAFAVGAFVSASLPGGFSSGFNAFEGRGGDDQIFGNGATRIEYTGAASGVTVDFGLGMAWGDVSVGTDTFFGVSQVRGSSFADTFHGSNFFSDESFDGRGGDDFIDGKQGFDRADYAFNGPVAVGIQVSLAAGTVVGDPVFTGTDTLRSIEAIRGTHKGDVYDARGFGSFSTNAGSLGTLNEFEGMAGDDTVWGNGNTRLTFANAREGVVVDLAVGTVTGGASVGNDTLMGGVNQMRGSSFDDVLMGSSHGITSAEVYEGRRGNDTYSGRGGFDQARYNSDPTSAGIAVLMASAAGSHIGTVSGDAAIGTDTLIDIVSVVGTFFDDTYDATGYFSGISGLGAFNEFDGNAGDDTITGNGSTRVSFLTSWDSVTVDLAAGTATGFASGNDTLINIFNVRGSNFSDTLLGSAGNDTFEGRGGNDYIDGREGFDLVRYDNGSSGSGTFDADAQERVTASVVGHDTDTLVNVESIRGTSFADTFNGSAATVGFTFDGRGGNDTLIGSQGEDRLLGGDGNDLLRGGLGADLLDGGPGSDTFDYDRLEEAGDTIAGFQAGPGGDVLDIGRLLANSTSYFGGGAPLEDYVRLENAGANALLQIDPDGALGAQDWQSLATLSGHAGLTLAALQAGGNLDTLI